MTCAKQSCWQPHRDVIFVLFYRTTYYFTGPRAMLTKFFLNIEWTCVEGVFLCNALRHSYQLFIHVEWSEELLSSFLERAVIDDYYSTINKDPLNH